MCSAPLKQALHKSYYTFQYNTFHPKCVGLGANMMHLAYYLAERIMNTSHKGEQNKSIKCFKLSCIDFKVKKGAIMR